MTYLVKTGIYIILMVGISSVAAGGSSNSESSESSSENLDRIDLSSISHGSSSGGSGSHRSNSNSHGSTSSDLDGGSSSGGSGSHSKGSSSGSRDLDGTFGSGSSNSDSSQDNSGSSHSQNSGSKQGSNSHDTSSSSSGVESSRSIDESSSLPTPIERNVEPNIEENAIDPNNEPNDENPNGDDGNQIEPNEVDPAANEEQTPANNDEEPNPDVEIAAPVIELDDGIVLQPPYKKPQVCEVPTPSCCVPGKFKLNLARKRPRGHKLKEGGLAGVDVKFSSRSPRTGVCSTNIVLVANFEKIDQNGYFGSLEAPYCGRRMLKIELQLSNANRNGWLLNVGDSIFNDGADGGIADTESNNAEIGACYPDMTVYPSRKCPDLRQFAQIMSAISAGVNTVTLFISNEHIRIVNDAGLDYQLSHKCLFSLNDQSNPNGNSNEEIFIGLNRVIGSASKTGDGICSATISWACPWCS